MFARLARPNSGETICSFPAGVSIVGFRSLGAGGNVRGHHLRLAVQAISKMMRDTGNSSSRAPHGSSVLITAQSGGGRAQPLKKPPLGLEVVLKILVIIQMVLRQIGEHGDGEMKSPHPLLGQRVG